ncbi:CobW family GTP-binding protein [Winogradskya humida]|uniref:Cobalamin biosynthesis protein CobW n=1 Tax=Winogradskya humida TaxID=113566 RepID=A0ABQ3ZZR8_9ACTN|nr:GTP-binding protein [Actinoplanes humidus]GIE23858.1 cobalamin biosynthesis protein CobW [Actinoplanes humidus]
MTHAPRVTVLAGFSSAATAAVARALLVTDPSLVLLTHDLSAVREGVVRRTIRTAAEVLETAETHLVHGCASCAVREDVLPALVRLSQERPDSDIILALPPAIEPELIRTATVHFDSFVTVVEAGTFLDDLTTTDELTHRDLHAADNDHRGVADVLTRQIESADTIVVWGTPDHLHDALLHRLAPWAAQVRVGDTPTVNCTELAAQLLRSDRHNPAVPATPARALEGYPLGLHDPAGDHGVNAVLFEARRPFHPDRLHDALDDLTGMPVRGRGQLWIATRPATAISWESAGGGLLLGNLGHWLTALPRDRWPEASPMRRLAADLTWDPYYGDRRTVLSFVGLGLDAPALTALLNDCLLTDQELAEGMESWQTLPDPFADVIPLVSSPAA